MNLKEYLQIVYELESSVFQQNQLIRFLEDRCNIGEQPVAEKAQSNSSSIISGVLLCILSTICFIGPFIMFGMSLDGSPWLLLALILIPVGIYLGIKLVRKAIDSFHDVAHITTMNNQGYAQYNKASTDYTKRLIEQQVILAELPGLKNKAHASRQLLSEFYAVNMIHPNYRSLIPISSINKYIQTGICSTLEGVNGAYSRYEYERQMNAIIDKLDIVIAQLDSIRRTQEMLYDSIQESNRISRNILQSIQDFSTRSLNKFDQINGRLNSIEKNQHISNYTANLIRKEIAYRNYLTHGTTYRHWKY